MGLLKNVRSRHDVALGYRTLIGRSGDSDLRIDDKKVSAEHAVIRWTGSGWELKDLASRNGTVVDGWRIPPGTRVALSKGSSFRFGSPSERWELASSAPPDVVAISDDGSKTLQAEHGHLMLDDGSLIYTDDGANYWLEQAGNRRRVRDGEIVETASTLFRLSIPPPELLDEATATVDSGLSLSTLLLSFSVSPDEEHVQLTLKAPDMEHRFRPRSFDYMLLALARARLSDARSETVPPSEHGWRYADELAESLGLDVGHLNVDIYRARRRMAEVVVENADALVERRSSTRAIRLGTANIELE